MANLHALKTRIDSIDKTASITKAMYKIASSKLLGMQENYRLYHSFKDSYDPVLFDLLKYYDIHPFMGHKNPSKKKLYVLISADRGLVGGYHQNLFKGFLELIKDINTEDFLLVTIGKKAYSFAQKHKFMTINKNMIINPDQIYENIFQGHIKSVVDRFIKNEIGEIIVYSTHFINSVKQIPKAEVLLPIDRLRDENFKDELIFEGNKQKILEQAIQIYLQSRLYGLLIDAKLSELSSRILAMKNATDNASSAFEVLSLKYHQARQQKITAELLDIANAKL